MLTFTEYLIEKSLYKVDALLRADPSAGLQPGYASITPFLGSRASTQMCDMALAVRDEIEAKRIDLGMPVNISVRALIPTQHTVFVDDVKDIARKQHFDKPIQVVSHNGQFYIVNGHHRAAAAAIVNRPLIKAFVVTH